MKEEIVEAIKAALLPELHELRRSIVTISADIKIIYARLDDIDKRFEQVDKRFEQVESRIERVEQSVRELHEDLREMRSFMFVSKMSDRPMVLKETKPNS
ncbi:MAG TPA: hypothetical protein PKE12_13710 [Kiritimatiellia bacterium]|nr:hypothetical protein [Kiritimatiellia bacterium]